MGIKKKKKYGKKKAEKAKNKMRNGKTDRKIEAVIKTEKKV